MSLAVIIFVLAYLAIHNRILYIKQTSINRELNKSMSDLNTKYNDLFDLHKKQTFSSENLIRTYMELCKIDKIREGLKQRREENKDGEDKRDSID